MTNTAAARHEYARAATDYDEQWADYIARTTERTLAAVEPRPVRLLDVGCGTGALLREAAVRWPDAALLGADLAPPMIRVARERGTPGVLVTADAARLPIAAGSCDVIVSASALHFWPDPLAALRELRRVIRPDGTLVLTDWCHDYVTCRLLDRWLRWTGRATYHRIFGSRDLVDELAAAGFDTGRVQRYRAGFVWGLMTVTAHPFREVR